MNCLNEYLDWLLRAAAIGQIAIAGINLRLDRIMGWELELSKLSQLSREVFHVHKWFVSITLVIFGLITMRFAGEFANGASELARWIAAAIGIFWTIRAIIQWAYYDWSHWRGRAGRTAIHWTLTLAYSGFGAVYLVAAF